MYETIYFLYGFASGFIVATLCAGIYRVRRAVAENRRNKQGAESDNSITERLSEAGRRNAETAERATSEAVEKSETLQDLINNIRSNPVHSGDNGSS